MESTPHKDGPLSAVLKKHNVKIDRRAKFMTAESKDLPVAVSYLRPLHRRRGLGCRLRAQSAVADALEKSILALKLNGEALPEVHGGPVRRVRPGGGGK
jgi:DMSO/TMAO reductase YedYZ molybdopterin-dependent catalytic subunit